MILQCAGRNNIGFVSAEQISKTIGLSNQIVANKVAGNSINHRMTLENRERDENGNWIDQRERKTV
jgi:hypothetical protein